MLESLKGFSLIRFIGSGLIIVAAGAFWFTYTTPVAEALPACYTDYQRCVSDNCPFCEATSYCGGGQYQCYPSSGGGAPTPIPAPDPTSPSNGAVFYTNNAGNNYTVNFGWQGNCPITTASADSSLAARAGLISSAQAAGTNTCDSYSIMIYKSGVLVVGPEVTAGESFSYALSSGSYTWKVSGRSDDVYSLWSAERGFSIVLDTTAPSLSLISAPTLTNSSDPQVIVSASDSQTGIKEYIVQVYSPSQVGAACTPGASGVTCGPLAGDRCSNNINQTCTSAYVCDGSPVCNQTVHGTCFANPAISCTNNTQCGSCDRPAAYKPGQFHIAAFSEQLAEIWNPGACQDYCSTYIVPTCSNSGRSCTTNQDCYTPGITCGPSGNRCSNNNGLSCTSGPGCLSAPCTGAREYRTTSGTINPLSGWWQGDGAYKVYIYAVDNTNNISAPQIHTMTVDTTAPANPTSLVATSSSCTTVGSTLFCRSTAPYLGYNWNAGSDATSGISGYWIVFQDSTNGNWIYDTITSNVGGTSFGVSSLVEGRLYYTWVRSYDNAGNWNSVFFRGNDVVIDTVAPSHDSVSVPSAIWRTDNSATYDITLKSSEAISGIGGTYGIMALINYQGENAGQYRGYFAWHPTTYVYGTGDAVACGGGGYASKYTGGYGQETSDLWACSTSVVGNQRTVVLTVRPNSGWADLADNDVSMYTSDYAGNAAGWTNFQTNFMSDHTPPTGTVNIAGGAAYTKTSTVNLALTCADATSGCSRMHIWNYANCYYMPQVINTNYVNDYSGFPLGNGDGVKQVGVAFYDAAGNASACIPDTNGITLDTTAPGAGEPITIKIGTNAAKPNLGVWEDNVNTVPTATKLVKGIAYNRTQLFTNDNAPTFTISCGDGSNCTAASCASLSGRDKNDNNVIGYTSIFGSGSTCDDTNVGKIIIGLPSTPGVDNNSNNRSINMSNFTDLAGNKGPVATQLKLKIQNLPPFIGSGLPQ